MDTPSDRLSLYLELADQYDVLGQFSMRDRFLMLAADAALANGQPAEAEGLRQRILAGSRHHMLRPYRSFTEANRAPDVQTYLADLKANYPPDQARDLLENLRAGNDSATMPVHPSRSAVPPTAPLYDVNARQAARVADPPAPYPLRQEQQPSRPRAQPTPRVAQLSPVPGAQPVPSSGYRPAEESASGGWFSVVLSFLVITVALALAVLVLGRPYLPMEWLR